MQWLVQCRVSDRDTNGNLDRDANRNQHAERDRYANGYADADADGHGDRDPNSHDELRATPSWRPSCVTHRVARMSAL